MFWDRLITLFGTMYIRIEPLPDIVIQHTRKSNNLYNITLGYSFHCSIIRRGYMDDLLIFSN